MRYKTLNEILAFEDSFQYLTYTLPKAEKLKRDEPVLRHRKYSAGVSRLRFSRLLQRREPHANLRSLRSLFGSFLSTPELGCTCTRTSAVSLEERSFQLICPSCD